MTKRITDIFSKDPSRLPPALRDIELQRRVEKSLGRTEVFSVDSRTERLPPEFQIKGISVGPLGKGIAIPLLLDDSPFSFPLEKYRAPVTYSEDRLKEALDGAGSIQDFFRILWDSAVEALELDGVKRTPRELAQFGMNLTLNREPAMFSLGWFGEALGKALLDLVNFEALFPGFAEVPYRYLGEGAIASFAERLAGHAHNFFNLIRYTVPETMPFAEGYSRLIKIGETLKTLDPESLDYPIEVLRTLKKSGLNFDKMVERIERALVGLGKISDISADYHIGLDPFGLIKELGAYSYEGMNRVEAISTKRTEKFAKSDALLLKLRIESAVSLEELLNVLRTTEIDIIILDRDAFVTDVWAQAIENVIGKFELAQSGSSDILGVGKKVEELIAGLPVFVRDDYFRGKTAKEGIFLLEELLFSEQSGLKKYIFEKFPGQEAQGVWETVMTVASGQKLLLEVTRNFVLRGMVAKLMKDYVEASKAANREDSKPAASAGILNFIRWPQEGKAYPRFIMETVEEQMSFALFVNHSNDQSGRLSGKKEDRRRFATPRTVKETIDLAVKYAGMGLNPRQDSLDTQNRFRRARSMIESGLLSLNGMRHNQFWKEATLEQIEIVLNCALKGEHYFRTDLTKGIYLLTMVGLKGYHREMGLKFDPVTLDVYVMMGRNGSVPGIANPLLFSFGHIHPLVPFMDENQTINIRNMLKFLAGYWNIMPSVFQEDENGFGGDILNIKGTSEIYTQMGLHKSSPENFFYHHGYFWGFMVNPLGITIFRYKNGNTKVFWSVHPSKDVPPKTKQDLDEIVAEQMTAEGAQIDTRITAEEVAYSSIRSFLFEPLGELARPFLK